MAGKCFAKRWVDRKTSRIVDHGGAPARAQIMERFANIPVQVRAGVHDVVVTFIERAEIQTDEFVSTSRTGGSFGQGLRAPRMIDGVTVVGPFDSPGVSKTASRERLFICQPQPAHRQAKSRPAPARSSKTLHAARSAGPSQKTTSIP